MAKFESGFLVLDAKEVENFGLYVAAVNSDRTRGHLKTIADHVVGIRKDRSRVGVKAIEMLQAWHSEWVVGGIPFLELLIPFEHREVDDIGKGHHIGVHQFQAIAEPDPNRTKCLINCSGLIRDQEDQIAGLRPDLFG